MIVLIQRAFLIRTDTRPLRFGFRIFADMLRTEQLALRLFDTRMAVAKMMVMIRPDGMLAALDALVLLMGILRIGWRCWVQRRRNHGWEGAGHGWWDSS